MNLTPGVYDIAAITRVVCGATQMHTVFRLQVLKFSPGCRVPASTNRLVHRRIPKPESTGRKNAERLLRFTFPANKIMGVILLLQAQNGLRVQMEGVRFRSWNSTSSGHVQLRGFFLGWQRQQQQQQQLLQQAQPTVPSTAIENKTA